MGPAIVNAALMPLFAFKSRLIWFQSVLILALAEWLRALDDE